MKILVLGAGKMGTWLCDALCLNHEVGVYDPDIRKLSYVFNTIRMPKPEEIIDFGPEMVINAANLQKTENAFRNVLPFISKNCLLADIASVKNGLHKFYTETGHPFVSVHPMFGPTFASLSDLSRHHAVIITESDDTGKEFFRHFLGSLELKLHELSFDEHDLTIAYSLSVPFASSLVFAACMQPQDAPGTTFEKHLAIARGLLSEDDHLLGEILFNPHSKPMMEKISEALESLKTIIQQRDHQAMSEFLMGVRSNLL